MSTILRQVFAKFIEFFMCWGFPQKNFAPGSPESDDLQLGRPTVSQYPCFYAFRIFRVDRCGQRFQSGPVNPDRAGKSRRFGSASYEALRVTLVSNIEHILALPQNVFRLAIVHHRRREQAQAGMAMFSVIPAKKSLTESTAILNAPETVRELRPILQGAELAFRVGLSFETCGRLCVLVTPRSASKNATGLELIDNGRL